MKKRADGRWQKKKVIDGKTVFFFSTAETEKQAIKDFENQILNYHEKTHYVSHNFKALAEKAIERQSEGVGYKTAEGYYTALKHFKRFENYNIENITFEMVQDVLDYMAKKEKYSYSSVHKAKITFGIILDYAIGYERLPITNFKKLLKVPKDAKKGKVSSPPDLIRKTIIENAETVEFGMWAMCLLCLGLRRGELAGLQRKKIDFEKNLIMIDESVEFISNQPHLKQSPKTEASIDSVPILSVLRPYLEKLCKDLQPDDFLFGKEKPLTITQIRKRWDKYCTAIGYRFNGHQLRHAYAKMIYEARIDAKTAQRLLRHADISTTMNIYTDFSESLTAEAVSKLNDFTQSVVKK